MPLAEATANKFRQTRTQSRKQVSSWHHVSISGRASAIPATLSYSTLALN